MRRSVLVRRAVVSLALGGAALAATIPGAADDAPPRRSGSTYMSAEIRAMQADDFANPGMLWVERGAKLWNMAAGASEKSCADCHGDATQSMKGVATRYPAVDRASGKLLDVEGRINQCRAERQRAQPLAFESDEMLSLSSWVAYQSRGMPLAVAIDGPAAPHFARGKRLHERRIGQMNLACVHCHDENAGKRLLAETISEGHPNAWPGYRLEWQNMGSLQRRLRACYSGVRAELPPYGAQDLLDLSLYITARAKGLAIESPGVRR